MQLNSNQIRTIMEWCEGSSLLTEAAPAGFSKIATQDADFAKQATLSFLNTKWKEAGSPRDSNELAKLLTSLGVKPAVIASVYKTVGAPTQDSAEPVVDYETAKKAIMSMRTRDLNAMLKHVANEKASRKAAPKQLPSNNASLKTASSQPSTDIAPSKTVPKPAAKKTTKAEPNVGNLSAVDKEVKPVKGITANQDDAIGKTSTGKKDPKTGKPIKVKNTDPELGDMDGDVPKKARKTTNAAPVEEPSVTEPEVAPVQQTKPASQSKEKAALLQPRTTPAKKPKEKAALLQPKRKKVSI